MLEGPVIFGLRLISIRISSHWMVDILIPWFLLSKHDLDLSSEYNSGWSNLVVGRLEASSNVLRTSATNSFGRVFLL
jgi:hypothetical protein